MLKFTPYHRYLPVILLIFLAACSKENEEVVVSGNQAPPDTTVEAVIYENYLNRTYILVLGREPDSIEYDSGMSILRSGSFSVSARNSFLSTLFNLPDYRLKQYETWNIELLNNLDTNDINNQISLFNLLLQDSTYIFSWPVLQLEVDRLELLQQAFWEYTSSSIGIKELHRRMINNYFYDQINMGAANFVISSFQNFLSRNPTQAELQNGESMVNGFNAVLFLQSGAGKDDYLNIFFNSSDYYEGAVIYYYRKFLFRDPETVEMAQATLKYIQSNDYEQLQKDILASDEFAGL